MDRPAGFEGILQEQAAKLQEIAALVSCTQAALELDASCLEASVRAALGFLSMATCEVAEVLVALVEPSDSVAPRGLYVV